MSRRGADQNLRWKVLLPVWLCVLLLVSSLWLLIEGHVQQGLRDAAEREVNTHAGYLVDRLPANPTDAELAELSTTLAEVVSRTDAIGIGVYLATEDLDVLVRVAVQSVSDSVLAHFPWSIPRPERSLEFTSPEPRSAPRLHVVTSVILEGGKLRGAVRIVSALGEAGRLVYLHRWMAAIAVLILALSYVFADRVARMLSAPLERITHRVRGLIRGEYGGDRFLGETGQLRMVGRRLNVLARHMRETEDRYADQVRKLRRALVDRTRMLHEAYEDIDSLDRAKESFLSNLSHEMLTPLTAIMAAEDILRSHGGENDETREEFLGMIQQESGRLLHLINELLDLAKLEARALELDLEEVDICALAEEIAGAVFGEGRETSVALSVSRPSRPILCTCDRERVARIIRSLVHGAFRNSPDGGSVRVALTRGENAVILSVEDELADSEARFGDVFQDPSRPSSDQPRLGFALAQKLAKAHGGSLLHRPSDRGGTVVELRLPLRRVPAAVD